MLDERFVPTPGRWQALRSVLGGQKGRGRGERCDLPVFAVGRGGVCGAHRQGSPPPAGIVVQTRSVRVASPGDGLSSMAGEDGGVMNLTQGDTLLSPRRAAFRPASSLRPRWPREGKGRKRLGVSRLPS